MVETVESDLRRDSEQKDKTSFVMESDDQNWNKLQHDTTNHKKRIKDLLGLASESRARIDALLGRRTKAREDYDDGIGPLPSVNRITYDNESDDSRGSRRGSRDSDGSRRSSRDSTKVYDADRSDNERRNSDADRRGNRSKAPSTMTTKIEDSRIEDVKISIPPPSTTKPNPFVQNIKITMPESMTKPSPKVKPKPPAPSLTSSPGLIKKPFKFGMVSLQVKLEDN